jgi:hypothetical protein
VSFRRSSLDRRVRRSRGRTRGATRCVEAECERRSWTIASFETDVLSGRDLRRPGLCRALDGCRWTAITSIAALLISALAVWSSQEFRIRDSLSDLLARFDANHFLVRMWRIEQLTRDSGEPWGIHTRTVSETRELAGNDPHKLATLKNALATDLSTERIDMQAVYFFALEVRAWLPRNKMSAKRRAAPLNRTFGYQLLSTFYRAARQICCRS